MVLIYYLMTCYLWYNMGHIKRTSKYSILITRQLMKSFVYAYNKIIIQNDEFNNFSIILDI